MTKNANLESNSLKEAIQAYQREVIKAEEAEKKSSAIMLEVIKRRNIVSNILLETKDTLSDELIHNWKHGWNFFELGGLKYKFRFNKEDWEIRDLEEIFIANLDRKEVADA